VRVRLATYNIHKCLGGVDRRYDPQRVRDVLAPYKPDVVLLQEAAVLAAPFRDRQAELLAALLDLPHVAFAANVTLRGGGQYGNAVLSRFALSDVVNVDLTFPPKKRRSALFARCRLRREGARGIHSRSLVVCSLHLGLAGLERRLQVSRLLQCGPLRRLHARTPLAVGGDFNDFWGLLGPRLFAPAGFRGLGRFRPTFPAWAPLRALDSLYLRGDVTLVASHVPRSLASRRASDHLPIVADLEIAPPRPRAPRA
jgi:endonuclease/exonuclease/phosphatase family metal-dependent hydrolase